ncbi:hypothetical protein CHS0354_034184 [Potamilus streckersoni]|uniref:BSD domain-containing protein n=1 Tax=Potamilus streckersoni TaxID=2493646 RepID=A0AAE0VH47_9BIVA|nr:hypothetical protein CHS0354_034184 [Potamilus streckersoni]
MASKIFNSVTNWLRIDNTSEEKDKDNEQTETSDKETFVTAPKSDPISLSSPDNDTKKPEETEENEETDPFEEAQKALEEASAKAINTAKEWGSYLYSFGKQATKNVAESAKNFTKAVEDKTFLSQFNKEQEKFMNEKRDKDKRSEAAVPPWVGYNEEEVMKFQILALSSDKRNFVRNPPTGIQFQFDYETSFPVAMATLQEDPNLQKMRFEIVPKYINEETFWRNYFYRVSLIKQSTQLTSLAQQTGSTGEKSNESSQKSSTSSENKEKPSPQPIRKEREEELPAESPHENEFVSDTFQSDEFNDVDFRKEMEMLGMEDKDEQKEEGDGSMTDSDWEQALIDEYVQMMKEKK